MTFPASWVRFAMDIDPAEDLRGTYRTKDEAHSIIAAHGGELSFMEAHLLPHGFERVSEALTGDIGLVRMMAGESYEDAAVTEVGAIRFGPLWASIAPGGVRATKAEMVAAWRMPK
jgi:hypothetical protein